jgi:predicted permease
MQVILAAALPVLLTVLVGYVIARTGRPFDSKTITFLVGTLGTPVLIFYSLTHTTVPAEALARISLATLLAVACFMVVGAVVLRAAGLSLSAYLPSLSFPNTGNLGLPLSLYAFGDAGLDYAIAIFAVVAISNHTAGQTISAGRGQWRAVASNPVIPAVVLGVACSYFQIILPVWLDNTFSLLAGLTIPLMLLMLGTSLARIPVTAFSRAAWLSVFRIGMGAVVGVVIAMVFGFEGAERGAFVLQCAMPVAVYNYVYAQIYNQEPEQIASLTVVSTVLSVVTVPLLLSFLVE